VRIPPSVSKQPVQVKGVSVILCSKNHEICEKAVESIKATIGIEFEIMVFDNNDKNWGICKVYNYCAAKAKYKYLCFVHEDVILPTPNWGKNMAEFAEKTPNCGVIGFAGGIIATKNFVGWGAGVETRCRYYEGDRALMLKKDFDVSDLEFYHHNPENLDFAKVVTLDGLFMFTSYDVWKENPFDEETIKGFHFYDADFTFAVAQKRQNYACMTADVYHFSSGSYDKSFYLAARIFQKKWKDKLPYVIGNEKISFASEYFSAFYLHKNSVKHGLSLEGCENHLVEINRGYEMNT